MRISWLTRFLFKMVAKKEKNDAVRDILSLQLLADDDDDLVLMAHEGLRDLAQLGSARFAIKHTICGEIWVESDKSFIRCIQLNEKNLRDAGCCFLLNETFSKCLLLL